MGGYGRLGYGGLREVPGYLDSTDSRDFRDSYVAVAGGYGRFLEIPEILEIPSLVAVTGGYGRLREVTGGYGRLRLREVPGYLDSTDSRDFRDS